MKILKRQLNRVIILSIFLITVVFAVFLLADSPRADALDPIPDAYDPVGWLDIADCDRIAGWAVDKDTLSTPMEVHIYKDGPAGAGGTFVISAIADIYRAGVNSYLNVTGNHGFSLPLPDSLKDGRQHTIYVHGIDSSGKGINKLLKGVPKNVLCAAATPTPTPTPALTLQVQLLKDRQFVNGFRALDYCYNFDSYSKLAYGNCVDYKNPPGYTVKTIPNEDSPNDKDKYWTVVEGIHKVPFCDNGKCLTAGQELHEHRMSISSVVENTDSRLTVKNYNNWGFPLNDAQRDTRLVRSLESDKQGKVNLYINTQNEIRNVAEYFGSDYKDDTWPHFIISQFFKEPVDIGLYEQIDVSIAAQIDSVKRLSNWPNLHEANFQTYVFLREKENPLVGLWVGLSLFSTNTRNYRTHFSADQYGISLFRKGADQGFGGPVSPGQGLKTIQFELKSLIKDAIQYSQGTLKPSPDDYTLERFSIGWEIIGHYEIRNQFRDMSVVGKLHPVFENGYLDDILPDGTLMGWAFDSEDPSKSIDVHIYKDRPAGSGGTYVDMVRANQSRPSVNSTFGILGNHGFSFRLPESLKKQYHRYFAHGINVSGQGSDRVMKNSGQPFSLDSPLGYFDEISSDGVLQGWAFDPDASKDSLEVHIYRDGPAGQGTFVARVATDRLRSDVNRLYGITGNHGFYFKIPDNLCRERHIYYIYAIKGPHASLPPFFRSFVCPSSTPTPTPTPTATPTPTPVPDIYNPVGWLDTATCEKITGWAVDKDTSNDSIKVHIYKDGPAGAGGTFVISAIADIYRAGVNSYLNVTGNHGFSLPLPDSLKDGRQHTIYVHGIDSSGKGINKLLDGASKTITCVSDVSLSYLDNLVPFYRLYNPITSGNLFYYTELMSEKDTIIGNYPLWSFDKALGYVSAVKTANTSPLYRLRTPSNSYYLTPSVGERRVFRRILAADKV